MQGTTDNPREYWKESARSAISIVSNCKVIELRPAGQYFSKRPLLLKIRLRVSAGVFGFNPCAMTRFDSSRSRFAIDYNNAFYTRENPSQQEAACRGRAQGQGPGQGVPAEKQ